jgi:hypothetical protein
VVVVAVDERAVDIDERSGAGHALSLPDAGSAQSPVPVSSPLRR